MPSVAAEPLSAEVVVRRYLMRLAYDGSQFHGWQKQKTKEGLWLRTVQGVVEEAVAQALAQPIRLVGASRTDSGVHALGQVAQFDAATAIPVERLAAAINARLPEDVEVLEVRLAPKGFDCINAARAKQYRYRIFTSPHRPLHRRNYVWHCWWDLDVERMNAAAQRLVGEHDFSSFTSAGSPRQSNVRTIFECRVEKQAALEEVHVVVCGNGFLYNMVRIIAGTLVEVGRGQFSPEDIDRILAARDRQAAGPTLPPQGLWLEWIRYDV